MTTAEYMCKGDLTLIKDQIEFIARVYQPMKLNYILITS